jgi:hypothetical protein
LAISDGFDQGFVDLVMAHGVRKALSLMLSQAGRKPSTDGSQRTKLSGTAATDLPNDSQIGGGRVISGEAFKTAAVTHSATLSVRGISFKSTTAATFHSVSDALNFEESRRLMFWFVATLSVGGLGSRRGVFSRL